MMAPSFILEIADNTRIVKICRDDLSQFNNGTSLLQYIDKLSYARFFELMSVDKKEEGGTVKEINFIRDDGGVNAFFISVFKYNDNSYLVGSASPVELDIIWDDFKRNKTPQSSDDFSASAVPSSYTEYNKALNELSKVNNEMATLQRELNQKNILLERANADLEGFSSAVSHDLHAPVRGIIGFAELLEKKLVDKMDNDSRRLLEIIKQNATRMRDLITDLLNFSRLGKQELERKPVCTGKMVEQVIHDVLQLNPGRNIQWNIHQLADTDGDEKMLFQVWVNLISNAVKYSKKRELSVIEINSEENNKETVFYVKDNGAGFDEKYKAKLFNAFQRLHSYSDFEGTGIGLSTVQRIVAKHGGRVWAEGEVNKGATFYFSLPRLQ